MAKVKNPHDIYAKRIFRNPSLAADFFRHYLAPDLAGLLDFERLALDEGAFADKRLQQHFSDLLFRVPLKTGGATLLKLLLEHKSQPPPRVGVQLFRYMGHIWSNVPEQEDLPLIIPVVLYHGREPWNVPQDFAALFKVPPELEMARRFVPAFSFHLCDLAAYNDGALLGGNELQTKLLLLKHIFSQDFLQRFPGLLHEMMVHTPLEELNEELETAIWYAQHGGGATQEQTADALTHAIGGLGDKNMQTIVDKWRQEGRIQGLTEGVGQGVQQVALLQLQKKFGALNKKLEAQIAELPTPQLTELSMALLDFQQPKDLAEWLKQQSPTPVRKTRKKN